MNQIDQTEQARLNIDVSGKVAVVTGAGRGMGYAVAKGLLQAGASVAAWDIQETPELQALQQTTGDRLTIHIADVSSKDGVKRAVEATISHFGKVNIVVNCAGIMVKQKVDEIDMDAWDRIFNINLKGTLLVNQLLIPHLKQSGYGRIINISSMTSKIGLETYAPYSASKAAVSNLTKVMASELAPYGITVNALCPGWVDTPMLSPLFDRIAAIHGLDREQAEQEVLNHVPQKRWVHPDEIAFAVLFLSSPMAQGISAAEFMIDNGLTNMFKPGLHMRHE